MKVALFNGILGVCLTLWVSIGYLQLNWTEGLGLIGASILAGIIALLTTLQMEQLAWVKKYILNRSLKTWAFHISLFLGIIALLCPVFRSPHPILILLFPLTLVTGFSIIIFGPIQDRIVHRRQRKLKEKSQSKLATSAVL